MLLSLVIIVTFSRLYIYMHVTPYFSFRTFLLSNLLSPSLSFRELLLWQIVRAPDGQTHGPIRVDSMSPAGVFGPLYSRPLLHASRAFQKAFSDEIVKILGKNLMQFHFHQRLLMSTIPEGLFA